MNPAFVRGACAALALAAGHAGAQTAPAAAIDYGRAEYAARCASCHGPTGTGDGHFREFLNRAPTDLTTIARANGGVSESVRRLSQSLTRFAGIKVDVVSIRDSFTAADAAAWDPILPRCLDVRGPAAFGYAPGFVDALMETSADVTHTAGLWMYPSVANRSWTKRTGA